MTNEDAIRIVREQGFGEPAALGPQALRTIPALIEELERTRARGYAIAYEEAEAGMAGVAVPIPGPRPNSSPVGTLSVAGPVVRLTRDRLHGFAPELIDVAKRLSELWPIRLHQADLGTLGSPRRDKVA
jgi:DNA-binding IclR family transcriptional regulator